MSYLRVLSLNGLSHKDNSCLYALLGHMGAIEKGGSFIQDSPL